MPEQIKSIYDYIANHLLNEPASCRMKITIEQKLSNISTFPKVGILISTYINDVLNLSTYIQVYTRRTLWDS